MRSNLFARTRKWIGASALAILVGMGGGAAFVAGSSQMAAAQVTPAAEITVPATTTPLPSFADLVDAVKPAVVSIVVEGRETNSFGGQFNPQIPDLPDDNPLRRFFDQFGNGFGQGPGPGGPGQDQGPGGSPGIPGGPGGPGGPGAGPGGPGGGPDGQPQGRRFTAAGSGFAISADGYVVTNNHVVDNASKVTVIFDDGTEKSATVVGTDERTDLAVIKVDGVSNLPFVKFATKAPRVGDWVVAVGNPFGFGGSVTAGIISALGRDVAGSAYGDFLQIDAAINSGNSGGPAFNLNGEVVGVNSEIYTPNGGNVGIAFAIPADTVARVTSALIENGVVTRGYLGVSIQDVTKDIADSMGLKSAKGALVTQLTDESPAGKAGIKSGDVITAVNGKEIDDALALSRTISSEAPGTVVELKIWRGNAETTVSATLGKLDDAATQQATPPPPPAPEPPAPAPSSVGITLVPNSDGAGLLIQNIEADSVAADKGFAVGDTILEVDNKPVSTAKEFEDALSGVKASGRGTALIKAQRDGNVRFIGLPLTSSQG